MYHISDRVVAIGWSDPMVVYPIVRGNVVRGNVSLVPDFAENILVYKVKLSQ